jgi:preprotein translocase subunit YajC
MARIIIPAVLSVLALSFVLWLLFNKRQKPWEEMNEEEKKKKKVMIFSGLAVFIAGLLAALALGRKEKQ